MDIIITNISNVTSEGVTLHFNKKARLKTGNVSNESVWVSWDKIGKAIVEGYTEKVGVDDLNKLRNP